MILRMFVSVWAITVICFEVAAQLPGDLNGDDEITAEDADWLCRAIATGQQADPAPDLNSDGELTYADMETMLELVDRTQGDLNFDGIVQFDDFVKLSAEFGKENATWSQGDTMDCNGSVTFVDFLGVYHNYGERFETSIPNSVPEPDSRFVFFIGLSILSLRLRQTRDR